MRKQLVKTGLLSVLLGGSMQPVAWAAPWNGSYEAQGQCYCVGTLPGNLAQKIIPTPIGGQTVRQACDRIGQGPALKLEDGLFNYPVFKDPQCGHGPFNAEVVDLEDDLCTGSLDAEGKVCAPKGSAWDLKTAYSKPAQKTVQASVERATEAAGGAPAVVNGPRYVVPQRQADGNSVVEPVVKPKIKPAVKATVAKSEQKQPAVRKTKPKKIAATPEQLRERQQALIAEIRAREQREAQAKADAALQEQQVAEQATEQVSEQVSEQVTEQVETENLQLAKPADAPVVETVEPDSMPETVSNNDTTSPAKEAVDQMAESGTESASDTTPTLLSALRLPSATRGSSREFNYVQAQPVSFDFGGKGVNVYGSTSSHGRLQYFLDVSMADTYNDVILGMSYFVTPSIANRMTVLFSAGVEHGTFEFSNNIVSTKLTDIGLYLGLSSRFVVNNKFEIHAGATYSHFFEGDLSVFGAGYVHMTPRVDFITKLELGDNDMLGLGLRYYYQ